MTHFIAWPGNKRQEIPHILELVPDLFQSYDTFIEPFAGSAAISHAAWRHRGDTARYVLGDTDPWLVGWVQQILAPGKLEAAYAFMRRFLTPHGFEGIMRAHKELVEPPGSEVNTRSLALWAYRANVKDFNAAGRQPNKWPLLRPSKAQIAAQAFYSLADVRLGDWLATAEEHLQNPKAIIVLDPPYITSWNAGYYGDKGAICDDGSMMDPTAIYVTIKALADRPDRRAAMLLVSNAPAILVDYLQPSFPISCQYPKAYGACVKRNGVYVRKGTTHIAMYAPAR